MFSFLLGFSLIADFISLIRISFDIHIHNDICVTKELKSGRLFQNSHIYFVFALFGEGLKKVLSDARDLFIGQTDLGFHPAFDDFAEGLVFGIVG